jgi:uncharacterized membrane protein YbhN (UPF0104 family)/tRNA A-37 threonylcarbamoyl transferase component Bud32
VTKTSEQASLGRQNQASDTENVLASGPVHRPADLLSALLALIALVIILASVHGLPAGSSEVSQDIISWVRQLPRWLTVGGTLVTLVLSLAVGLVLTITLFRADVRRAVNATTAAAVGAAAAVLAAAVWNEERGTVDKIVLHGSNPSTLVYACAFVALLTGSDLVRRGRWVRWCVLSAAALFVFAVCSETLAPYGLAAALLAGSFVGWLTRWSLGTTSARPTADQLTRALAAAGMPLTICGDAGLRRGRISAELADGTPVQIGVADRDARGAGLVRRLWAFLRLRTSVAERPLSSSRARLERLALASSLAERCGTTVPSVLALREIEGDALVLVTTVPSGTPLSSQESSENVHKLFGALAVLHAAGVAHRDLRAGNLVLAGDTAGFSSLDSAQPGASELLMRIDLVQLMTTAARHSGASVAVEALRASYRPIGEEGERAVASVLQPIALARWGWSEMQAAKGCLEEMRRELVGDAQLLATPLVRFRWRTVLTTVAIFAAAFLLVGQLSKVNLAGALAHASLPWCGVALLAAVVGDFAAAENLAAFVPQRLSLRRGAAVQLASAFLGVAAPPTVGHMAVNSRYLHRQGVDESSIAAAVALSQIVNIVTTVVLLLVIGVLTGSGVSRFKLKPSADVLMAIGAVVAVAATLLLIPRTRSLFVRNVWPRVSNVWPRLWEALTDPSRLALGGGANLLLTASYVVAFDAAIRAVGGHPPILATTVVFLAGNAVGSAAPTPGGVGAVEAALSAGLSAIGIPVHEGIPAVLVFRLVTYWLPIPLGWVAYLALERRGVL